MQLQINEKFKRLLDPLTQDELDGLEQSILVDGCRDPLVVWNGVLVDGHNRYKICTEYDIPFNVVEMDFDDEQAAFYWIISNQLARRNITPEQVKYLRGKRYNEEKLTQGTNNQYIQAKGESGQFVHFQNEAEVPKQTTAQALADEYGVNEKTIRRDAQFATSVDTLADKLGDDVRRNILGRDSNFTIDDVNKVAKIAASEPETAKQLIEKVATGEARNLSQAITETKRAEVVANLESVETREAKAIQGVYDVIVIDYPWPMEKIEREVAPNQVAFEYPTMSLEEIQQLDTPTAEDCHIFMWTTQKFLPFTLDLIKLKGYKYVLTMVWHKNGGYQPFGLPQYNCEFVVYARKGTPKFIEFTDFMTCFNAKRGAHSEKPEEFYATLRRVTAGRRLDMFNRRAIEGFDTWGKEASNE